jgi:hypothetical protein
MILQTLRNPAPLFAPGGELLDFDKLGVASACSLRLGSARILRIRVIRVIRGIHF